MSAMERLFKLMAEKKASDIYISPHAPILIRINGHAVAVNRQVLTPEEPFRLLAEAVGHERAAEVTRTGELNLGLPRPGLGSFRISAFRQRGSVAMVVRYIPGEIPALESLNLPGVLADLVMEKHGLLLMVGSTGAGKSTTLAAMIDYRNANKTGHILTLEEPIEYLFSNRKSIVNQREVGIDTESLAVGLKNALRQAPDCIMIGEIRDQATMSAALQYSLSGHLCLATLHANNSYQALNRIVGFYPMDQRAALFNDMASGLRGIVSQRLLRATAGGLTPAVEIMLNTQLVRELIEKGDFSGVKEAMEKSMAEGSQTFEQALATMVIDGVVSREEALAYADSPTNLLWRLENDSTLRKQAAPAEAIEDDTPSFTEITLDLDSPR
ncbi:Twitching motility protein [Thiomonas arsenitoxydans]|uniref:Twitching motility protein n=2 Tax=Thiomonas arsenitoxydans (strain DSM 22701 / CIP 110005 / 3As) TaxID=426114 RepID=A0ABM9SZG3_THIA3|nr:MULTISPECIES: PilT/PilU family type 4a pilus ATPase [Thiomonas]CQR42553.1 Twitching motility protein [Thiomonas sp. CB3]MDD5001733.1 PilT/PilU family type 4a pilus ATPase [Thiomonas arsenitoxydans]CDW96031.1 Twitching motility protein [Thiomonas sp. CB2]CQR26300.1 Twitching motility protein [Thiomonas arsenitoxydans]CQR28497.1 Twitching motility protein [Thiomonas arsenitoxydans]